MFHSTALAPAKPSGFGSASTAEEVSAGLDLTGRRYLVTGATSGVGEETARVLALRGATVLCAARTHEAAVATCATLPGSTVPIACELSEPADVRACVGTIRGLGLPLDGIIANAGIMALPNLEQKYGYEVQFLTNYLGHFMLVSGLFDQLGPEGRVVVLTSEAHRHAPPSGIEFDNLSGARNYHPWRAYAQSKLANLLLTRELARRWSGTRRTANAVHPGVIATRLGRYMPVMDTAWSLSRPVFKTVAAGAATQTWAAVHPDAAALSGHYVSDCNVAVSSAAGRDMALSARLWAETERIVAALG
jgi:WW domain-containing oxidoreductase